MTQALASTINRYRLNFVAMLTLTVLVAVDVLGSALQAQTAVPPDISIDVNPIFDNMEVYIPVFMAIFAIPAGIMIAIVLVKFIINAIRNAFEGKSI